MPDKLKSINPLARCYQVTAVILLTGFGAALTIYLTAKDLPDNPFADYENSKRFSHEVQRMGGKMSLVANDLSSWFSGLWQGQQLAGTVACITLVIAAVYYVVASGMAQGEGGPGPHDDNGDF